MAAGGAGEVAGQLASEGKITSPKSVLAEVIAEPASSVGEVGVGRVQQAITGGEKVAPAAPPAAPEAAPAPAPARQPLRSPQAPQLHRRPRQSLLRLSVAFVAGWNIPFPEEKAQAAPLASAAAAYVQNYDETLAPAEAHAQAVKEVPDQFKPAFQMLPRNAMEAEPAQFGEWLARAYEGGRAPAPAVEGKSVAQMIKEAKVQVETKESAQAMEGLAAEPAGAAAPSPRRTSRRSFPSIRSRAVGKGVSPTSFLFAQTQEKKA